MNYVDPSGYHPLVIAAIAIAGYLGTTAVETAPDVAIDYALDGEDFDLGKSFGTNFAMNFIPGVGELNKAKKGAMLGKVAVKNLPSALGKRVKKEAAEKVAKSTRETLLDAASNRKLKNTIDQLYRPGATIGDGGLADAIRYQLSTGELVGGKDHLIKGAERVRNLENIIKHEKLNNIDKQLAQKLLIELKNALRGK